MMLLTLLRVPALRRESACRLAGSLMRRHRLSTISQRRSAIKSRARWCAYKDKCSSHRTRRAWNHLARRHAHARHRNGVKRKRCRYLMRSYRPPSIRFCCSSALPSAVRLSCQGRRHHACSPDAREATLKSRVKVFEAVTVFYSRHTRRAGVADLISSRRRNFTAGYATDAERVAVTAPCHGARLAMALTMARRLALSFIHVAYLSRQPS